MLICIVLSFKFYAHNLFNEMPVRTLGFCYWWIFDFAFGVSLLCCYHITSLTIGCFSFFIYPVLALFSSFMYVVLSFQSYARNLFDKMPVRTFNDSWLLNFNSGFGVFFLLVLVINHFTYNMLLNFLQYPVFAPFSSLCVSF